MKILINVPDLYKPGGVAALFNILKMEQIYDNVSLFSIHSALPSILRIPYKYFEFILKLRKFDIVHLNPSLNKKSFLRDAVFAYLTKLFAKKLIVYWHGWELEYEQKIAKNKILNLIAQKSFFKADTTIVLGKIFEKKIRYLGYENKIIIETNSAENKYLINKKPKCITDSETINLLFLSRIETTKGIYIAIETLKILNKEKNKYKLIIAGSGTEEENIKKLISNNEDIEWIGYVTNESKHQLLNTSHIMFFPSYSEGLPLTLLEGMMYGMPVISRPIGGIPDMFINGENGYLIESLEPEAYAEKIELLVNSNEFYKQISINNIKKSILFSPENVRERIYKIYKETINF